MGIQIGVPPFGDEPRFMRGRRHMDRRALTDQPGEDRRLTQYRQHVWSENFVGSLRVFCGGVGLMTLFILALAALTSGTETGLFAGSARELVIRFGKFAFFLSCLWGLFAPWRDYSDENGKECSRRKEMLSRIEQDPNWWRKRDEERKQRQEGTRRAGSEAR
jgi:hypothetical protein